MRIQYASDIHIEFDQKPLRRNHVRDSDLLVLAGDIAGNPRELTSYVEKLAFLGPVLIVLGNHEYYGQFWDTGLDMYHHHLRNLQNVYLLENDSLEIKGIRFLGCALWTDFFGGQHGPTSEGRAFEGAWEEASTGLADFDRIFWSKSGTPRPPHTALKWEDVRDRHLESLEWLKKELAKPFSGKTVVITHHAPSILSNDPTYLDSSITGAFCNQLDDYILGLGENGPELWIHGHCHNSSDYKIGRTNVLCNPAGYPFEPNPDWNPQAFVEV